jgi:hypothetical protein
MPSLDFPEPVVPMTATTPVFVEREEGSQVGCIFVAKGKDSRKSVSIFVLIDRWLFNVLAPRKSAEIIEASRPSTINQRLRFERLGRIFDGNTSGPEEKKTSGPDVFSSNILPIGFTTKIIFRPPRFFSLKSTRKDFYPKKQKNRFFAQRKSPDVHKAFFFF